jgi:PAS domain-containing protein
MALNLINRNKGRKEVNLTELYEQFIENACECFFMFDKNLFALSMNEPAAKLTGVKNVKKTGADIKEILPNMHNTNRFDQFRDVLRTDKPIRFRDYIYREGETPKLYELSAFKMGSGLGVVAVNVSQRNTQAEPLKSENEYASAIQSVMHNPFIVLDLDYRVLKANKAFYDHFFLKPVDVINQLIYSLNETQWNIQSLHELLEYKISTNGSAKNYEVRSYFTGLGERTLKLNAKLYDLAEEGRKIIMLAINDITEIAKQRDNIIKN